MYVIACPMCSETLVLSDDIDLGDIVECDECDREFEVVSTQPLELEWVDEENDDEVFEMDEDFY